MYFPFFIYLLEKTFSRTFFPRLTRKTTTLRDTRQQETLAVPKCTHPNGNHSVKQSCPKTGKFSKGPQSFFSLTKKIVFSISVVRKRIVISSQMKVTKMLLIVSSVFVCLNMPSYVMRVRAFLEVSFWTPKGLISNFNKTIFLLFRQNLHEQLLLYNIIVGFSF